MASAEVSGQQDDGDAQNELDHQISSLAEGD
jgi:hypothetical protein